MFIIAVNDREAYAYAEVKAARTVEDAREKTIEAIKNLYDTSTLIVVKIDDDVNEKTIFRADTDAQVWNDDDGESVEVAEQVLVRLDKALAANAA